MSGGPLDEDLLAEVTRAAEEAPTRPQVRIVYARDDMGRALEYLAAEGVHAVIASGERNEVGPGSCSRFQMNMSVII